MEQGKKLDVYLGNDDKLHWDIYAKNLRQIILGCDSYPRSNDNLSYVIGIDSPWGTGKTYFTSMFSNYLQGYYYRPGSTTQAVETPKTCSVVYYDAWENDFWDNAFEPLFDKMFNSDTFKDLAEKTDVRDMAKSIGRMCWIGATGFLYKLAENVIDKDSIEKIGKEAENTWKKGMTDGTKIEALFPEYTDFREDWFVFGNSRFLPSTTIDHHKHKYFSMLDNISEITIHQFRHSHVSLLINEYIRTSKEKNMKVDTTKFFLMMSDRMGHSIKVMQETYMHLFPTIQDEVVDLLDNL